MSDENATVKVLDRPVPGAAPAVVPAKPARAAKTESSSPAKSASFPKWESTARERIASGLKRILKPIEALRARDAVEADTRMLVTDVLCDLLGYDKYDDLTAEYQVKGEFADYGIRVDKQLVAFVEVKRVSQKLAATHLRQVENYALKNGVSWAILTNAQQWQVYHVQAITGEQSELTLVQQVDLLDAGTKPAEKVERLFLISREAVQKERLNDYWKEKFATSAKALKPILLSEPVLEEVRKALWREMKQRIDIAELRLSVATMLSDD
jgi:predicted type IV restriction endonuclease